MIPWRDPSSNRPRLWMIVSLFVLLGAIWFLWPRSTRPAFMDNILSSSNFSWRASDHRIPDVAAGNATLGFQAILALSRHTNWRIHGLQAAAAYTGLHVEIPLQRQIPSDRLQAFKNAGLADSQRPGDGSAAAWLAHLDLLQTEVLDRGLHTALIVEDDVDWDITIREQMTQLSKAVRKLTKISPENVQGGKFGHVWPSPYGIAWDVLWLGNCGGNAGDAVDAAKAGLAGRIETWKDPSVIPHAKYSGWANHAVNTLPPRTRAVIWSKGPVCTFGYAVTNAGARKIVDLAGSGTDEAFDVKLSHLCTDELSSLNCLTVTPELMHEYKPAQGVAETLSSEVNAANGQGEAVKADDQLLETKKGSTKNIVNSARCRALFEETCLATNLK